MRVVLVTLAVVLFGCGRGMLRMREQVRAGYFTPGMHRKAFQAEWGPCAKTYTVAGEKNGVYAAWGAGVGSFSMGGRTNFVACEYPAHDVVLFFNGEQLSAWGPFAASQR